MRRLLLTVFILCSFSVASIAQNPGKITGRVEADNDKTAIAENTTVSLLKAKDSSVIVSSLLNQNGGFYFDNLSFGRYIVAVTAVGFQKSYSPVTNVTANNTSVQLPVIQLQVNAKTMNAVIVSSKKTLTENKVDRTIVNVEASVTNQGASALEVFGAY